LHFLSSFLSFFFFWTCSLKHFSITLSWDNLLLKYVGCNSDNKKNNNFVLKECMKWYHKPRGLNEPFKKILSGTKPLMDNEVYFTKNRCKQHVVSELFETDCTIFVEIDGRRLRWGEKRNGVWWGWMSYGFWGFEGVMKVWWMIWVR